MFARTGEILTPNLLTPLFTVTFDEAVSYHEHYRGPGLAWRRSAGSFFGA
jgi:hypothetical protein